MMRLLVALLLVLAASPAWAGPSVYLTAPDDPAAVWMKGVGDGKTDDSTALQSAIDAAANQGRGGIVFLKSGTYRISRTIFVRPAVRVLGVGPTRPIIFLGDSTPGFGSGAKTMLSFTGNDQYNVGKAPVPPPTSVPFDPNIWDATSSTFYSAIANVDFEIGTGNGGATAVRFRVAQHGFIRHADFRIGSGLAGIYQAGNECEDLHFYGGRYGILTEKTSPAWQFTLIDSTFDGQRDAAIREHEVDLTLVNTTIRNVPVGIEIDRGYSDSLWGKDVRFENVSKAAVIISNEDSAFTQVGFDNALVSATPVFAQFRDSGRTVAGKGPRYRVKSFAYGLVVPGLGEMGSFATNADIEPLASWPAPSTPAIRPIPPVAEWTNVRTLGVKGDDQTDDTAALQKAIDTNRILYVPTGRYRVSDTLHLRSDTILIALHPSATQIYLSDDLPVYSGVGSAKALIESAKGGDAIVTGVGLWTGNVNPRASALIWKAGERSMVNDVRILGGAGTILPKRADGSQADTPQFDSQHASIWVTDGGGGTFAAIWSPNTIAQAGFYVSDTSTPGHVYELSAEHHYRNEIVLDHVTNWEFLAPQTEQEVRDGVDALSTEIRNSSNILLANYHGYRVTRTIKPAEAAVRLYNSGDIRFRNVHVNAESGFASCDSKGCGTYLRASKYPFENAILDVTRKQQVREREFASLDVPAAPEKPASDSQVPVTPGLRELETGFWSIAGAATDKQGKLYFIDRWFQRIYAWSATEGLSIVSAAPLDPVNLAVDGSGHLLVLSSAGRDGTVYSIDPAHPEDVHLIDPTAAKAGAGAVTLLPVNWWNNGEFRDQLNPKTYEFTTMAEMFVRDTGRPKTREYVSPDRSLVLPAFRVWNQGPEGAGGWRWSDTLDSYGLIEAKPGERVFVTNESEDRTYSGNLGPGGRLTDLKPFANRGGESVAVDASGNVYVANGQIFVYSLDGSLKRRIDVPERPLQLVFGGSDGRTLFILSHHSLYAIEV